MPTPKKSTKREKQQISRASLSGHPRLCPHCNEMIGTTAGRLNRHGSTVGQKFECPGSGKKVKKAKP